ncbi:MAG: hypothetical protein ACPGVB_10485 [Chitinophagales bacterium]
MKQVTNLKDIAIYKETLDILRIGNIAVQKAKAENKKMGIPNVFGKNGIVYYELPDGTITKEKPEGF